MASGTTPSTPTRTQRLFPLTRKALQWVQQWLTGTLALTGQLVLMGVQAGTFIIKGRTNPKKWLDEMGHIATDALSMGMILVVVSSAVIALQVSQEMVNQGGETFVGALIAIALIRELGPIMSAVGLAAVMGTAYASEIATMNSEQQIDALRVFNIDPIRYVVVPRLLAGMTGLPAITLLTTVVGILAGMVVSEYFAEVQPHVFLDSVWQHTKIADVWKLLLKATIFGYLVALISTTVGYNSKGSARDVGIATTQAVVISFVIVSIADYLLTYALYSD